MPDRLLIIILSISKDASKTSKSFTICGPANTLHSLTSGLGLWVGKICLLLVYQTSTTNYQHEILTWRSIGQRWEQTWKQSGFLHKCNCHFWGDEPSMATFLQVRCLHSLQFDCSKELCHKWILSKNKHQYLQKTLTSKYRKMLFLRYILAALVVDVVVVVVGAIEMCGGGGRPGQV